jgi:mannose-1-phosphate guanylyltransferase
MLRLAGLRPRLRSWSAMKRTASWSPNSCAHRYVPPRAIVLEPVGRNTAPAIALAALAPIAAGKRRGAVAGAARRPRDPRCRGVPGGRAGRRGRGAGGAARHLRHRSAAPETGYGYIRRGAAGRRRLAHRPLRREARARAPRNSSPAASTTGTAACSCSAPAATSRSCERYAPDIAAACERAFGGPARPGFHAHRSGRVFRLPERVDRLRRDGEDHRSAVVIPLDAGWSDVGSWSSLHDASLRMLTAM